MHANNESPSIWKRVFRFLFIGIWESVYRRKKRRGLFRYHTVTAPTQGHYRTYYTRYDWIKKTSQEKNKEEIDPSK